MSKIYPNTYKGGFDAGYDLAKDHFQAKLAELQEKLDRIQQRFPLYLTDEEIEFKKECFAENPPSWAKDPYNNDCTSQCWSCGSWEAVVRPGKTQCDNCSDGKYTNAIIDSIIAGRI